MEEIQPLERGNPANILILDLAPELWKNTVLFKPATSVVFCHGSPRKLIQETELLTLFTPLGHLNVHRMATCDFIRAPSSKAERHCSKCFIWDSGNVHGIAHQRCIDIRCAEGIWPCIHKHLIQSSSSVLENQVPFFLWFYHLKHDSKVAVLLHSKLEEKSIEDYVCKVSML